MQNLYRFWYNRSQPTEAEPAQCLRGKRATEINETTKQEQRKKSYREVQRKWIGAGKQGPLHRLEPVICPSSSTIIPAEQHVIYQNRVNGGRRK